MAEESPQAQPEPALFLSQATRRYREGGGVLEILKGVDLALWPGEAVALVAPSGAGKSTLLHLAGLLDKPDDGEVYVGAKPTVALDDKARTALRRHDIGFVYQFHHLLPEFSALENVCIPQMIAGLSRGEAAKRAKDLLDYLGLGQRLTHRPAELSGGEQQRVAIARAVANAPRILLADEPTGNLDPVTAEEVFAILLEVVRDAGAAALIATHNPELAARMDATFRLSDGRVAAQPHERGRQGVKSGADQCGERGVHRCSPRCSAKLSGRFQ